MGPKKKSGWASGYLLQLVIFPHHYLWEHQGEGCAQQSGKRTEMYIELKWGLRSDLRLGHIPICLSSSSNSHLCTQRILKGGFQFDAKVGLLNKVGNIYVCNSVTNAGEGLSPSLPFPKIFSRIYSGNYLHLSTHSLHSLIHSLSISKGIFVCL